MMEEIDRNNLPLMQKIAEEQQVAHLQCAHVQAVKWLIQNRLSNELSCESASAYFHAAKHQLSEVQLEELQSLMKQSETENIEIVLARISHLLQDYPDLHQGFGIFLPPDLNLQMQTGALSHFDMKNKNENTLTDKGNISIKEEMMDASSSNETNSEVLQESFKNSLDKENDSIFLTKVKENMNGLNNTLENSDENCYSPFTTEPLRTFSPENDSSDAPAYSYGIYEQHLFFDKMKEACGYPEVYDNFLRFLNLYNEDYVTKSQLVEMVKYFFGGRPDLYKEFKDILGFNESGENIEAIPMKVIALENERKKVDPNGDIDFTTGGNGASYRPLSDNYDHPKCSGRTALCNEVLNDKWVSFPSSSEATFPKSCKTEYEEAMHRFEDELFELDIAKRDNKDTIHILEDLNRKLNKMTPDNRRKFILDEYLGGNDGIVQKRAFQRLMKSCQEHPRECNLEIINFIENSTKEHLQGNLEHCTKCLINSLMQNPAKGVPIILKGLNTSEKELNDLTDKFNEVWKKQLPQLVLKSKDTLGVNFRQKDPKSFQPKSLMTELEIIYIESKANQTFVPPHFKLHLKKREVFLDAINLILEYLKKLPGIFQDDKHKIELVICNFIPDFFCTPFPSRCADAEKEKIKSKLVHDDNNCGGRNCQNSCTCNIRGSSDQEKFNEENEEKNEKDNSIFKGDVFDKINTLPKTNMPYTVFFANKTWFIFFRQFYILYDRLAELLSKSRVLEVSEREIVKQRPAVSTQMLSVNEPWKTYPLLIDKLHKLMNGTLDYAQFEEEARSLYKIHAYISYTMDKLIHAIIRQVQHILTDDACKDCTALFLQHMTMLSSFEPSSFIETSQIEHEYQRKAERMLGNERCLKVAWHNNIHTLAIEILEQESDRKRPDPREAEIRSNYFDAYIREESCYDEILFADEVEQLPVILPRNLRKQQLYWKNKAIQIEKLHLKRQTHMKKRQPLPVRKRKSVSLNIVSRKRTRHSIEQEDSLHSSGNGATLADDYEANYDNDSFKSLPVDVKVMDEEGITNDTEVSEKFDIPNKNDSVHNKDEEKRVQTKVGTEEEKEVVENERIEYEEIEGNKSMIENEEEEHKKIDMFGESKCLVIKSKMICDDITDQSEESREVCMANEPEESERKLTEGTADQSEESKEVYMANEPEESERKIIEGAADQSDECTESECKESEKGNSFYEFEESEKNLPLTQQSMEKHLSGTELEAVFYNIAALCSSDYSINVSEKESEGDKIIENETTKLMGMEEKEIGCDKSKSLIKKSYMGIVQKIANQFEESEDIGNSIVESKDEEVIDYYKKATEDEYENEMRKIDEFHKLEILAKESEEMNDSINESAESDDETVKDYEKKAVEEDEVVKSEVDTCDASKNRIKNSEKKNVDYPVDKSKEPEEKISNDLAEVFKESEEMIGESAKYFEESIEESHYVSSDSKNSEEDNILADKLEGSREETADVLVEQPERTGERVVGNIKVQEVESAIDNGNAEETKIKKSIDSKYESACKVSNDVPVKENKIFEDITIVDLKPETIKNPKEIMKNEKNSCSVEESEPKSSNANVSKGIRERKKKRALSPENVSKTEIDLQSGMSDIQVVDRVLESTNGDDQKEIIVDSFSIGENKEESPNKMPDKRPSKLRKNRTSVKIKQQSQSNMKRKAKKAVIRNTNKKRRRQIKPKCEFLDDASFDFIYFFKLPEEEKVTYLALYYMTIDDDEQVFFNKTSYRMNFIQNRNLFLYRKNTLPKAKEIHQAVSEIKTSNFNAWHSLWLEKHVTPSMLKSCNEWLLKTERNRFISQRITVSEYAKPPYIPYYKYMVRYYQFVKDEKEEEMNTD